MCRITVNGKIAQFSCKLDVEEKVKSGRVSGLSIVAQEANRMLDKIRVGINRAYQQISDRDNYVTAEKVRNAYLGLSMNHETLLPVPCYANCKNSIKVIAKRCGIEKNVTWHVARHNQYSFPLGMSNLQRFPF